MSSTILGVPMKFPIFTAPSSGQGALHPDGEIGHVSGRHRGKRARGVCQRHHRAAPEDRARGERPSLAAVLSDSGSRCLGQAPPDVSGSGRQSHHHHRRPAGVGVRTRPARSPSRRCGADRRWRSRRRRQRGSGSSGSGACVGRADSDHGHRRARHRDVLAVYEVSRIQPAALVQLGLHRRGSQGHQGAGDPQGDRDRRRRGDLRQGRGRRHHRVESRRAVDGLRAVDARSAPGDRGCREREVSRS